VGDSGQQSTGQPSALAQTWSGAIQIAGAIAGLGVLVYLVGAATVWLRFEAAGLPADIAVEHQGRGELIALGIRGVAIVLVLVVSFGALFYFLVALPLTDYLLRRAKKKAPSAADPGAQGDSESFGRTLIVDVAAPKVRAWPALVFRILGGVGVLVIVAVSFTTWQWFGLTVGIVIVTACVLRYLDLRDQNRRPSVLIPLAAILAGAFAGLAWQINEVIPVQTVIVQPAKTTIRLTSVPRNQPIPYFGETGTHVFVGDVRWRGSRRGWIYCHRIIELQRDQVRLTFEAEEHHFINFIKPPAEGLVSLVRGHGIANPKSAPICSKLN
jgi:hypothetical protein